MAVDPYAICPCGSGKKLKFCCPDLATDLEKIHTMIEGDQPRAALRHVEQTLAAHPQRESLLDLKASLELSLEQLDAAAETVEAFVAVAPRNPSAFAQKAVMMAARDGGRHAVPALQQALALVDGDMPRRVLEAIGTVGQALLVEGNIIAARAHLWLYQGIAGRDDTRALQLLMRLNQMAGLPLPLRDHLYMHEAPEGHPGEADHQQAQWYASVGGWLLAAQAFDALCEKHPDEPGFVYNRALVYGWLGDVQRFVAGMHDYATRDVPEQDAIDAEAIAQLLDPALQDPPVDVVKVTFPIADEELLATRIAADARLAPYAMDPSEHAAEDGPPPRAGYLLLDKPAPASGAGTGPGDGLRREDVPSVVGVVSHYGRQTDRPERLELVIDKNAAFEAHCAALADACGDALREADGEQRVGTSSDAEQALSWRWHFPPDTPPARRRELLAEQRREAILERWPQTPRVALGGKTPREAAADPKLRTALAAAVSLLEQGSNNQRHAATFAELREQLGLPAPGPIDPAGVDIEQLPLSRVPRLELGPVGDAELVGLYRRAAIAGATAAVAHAAREIVARPAVHGQVSASEAYQRLIMQEDDTPAALALLDEARAATDAAGESNAVWDLMELELRVVEGQSAEANDLLQHLRAEHLQEPGVAEQLYQLLYALGATPDTVPMEQAPALAPAGAAAAAPAVGAAAEGGKIWTPDGQAGTGQGGTGQSGTGQAGGGQKLWTPS
ncbi:MAG: hypothetical protein AAF790_04370 [Planctomycetota bacterium]